MMRKTLVFGVCVFTLGISAAADDGHLTAREWLRGYSLLLGMTLDEAFQTFGVPKQVSTARGGAPWQDDAVFIYENGVSFFWYQDRVWQIRLGPAFRGNFSRLTMGSSPRDVLAALGEPFQRENDWFLYHFAGQGYPLRLRFFFGNEKLEDVYIYRGDF